MSSCENVINTSGKSNRFSYFTHFNCSISEKQTISVLSLSGGSMISQCGGWGAEGGRGAIILFNIRFAEDCMKMKNGYLISI